MSPTFDSTWEPASERETIPQPDEALAKRVDKDIKTEKERRGRTAAQMLEDSGGRRSKRRTKSVLSVPVLNSRSIQPHEDLKPSEDDHTKQAHYQKTLDYQRIGSRARRELLDFEEKENITELKYGKKKWNFERTDDSFWDKWIRDYKHQSRAGFLTDEEKNAQFRLMSNFKAEMQSQNYKYISSRGTKSAKLGHVETPGIIRLQLLLQKARAYEDEHGRDVTFPGSLNSNLINEELQRRLVRARNLYNQSNLGLTHQPRRIHRIQANLQRTRMAPAIPVTEAEAHSRGRVIRKYNLTSKVKSHYGLPTSETITDESDSYPIESTQLLNRRKETIDKFLRHDREGTPIGWSRAMRKRDTNTYRIGNQIHANFQDFQWASDMFNATSGEDGIDNFIMPRMLPQGEVLGVYNTKDDKWHDPEELLRNRITYQHADPYLAKHIYQSLWGSKEYNDGKGKYFAIEEDNHDIDGDPNDPIFTHSIQEIKGSKEEGTAKDLFSRHDYFRRRRLMPNFQTTMNSAIRHRYKTYDIKERGLKEQNQVRRALKDIAKAQKKGDRQFAQAIHRHIKILDKYQRFGREFDHTLLHIALTDVGIQPEKEAISASSFLSAKTKQAVTDFNSRLWHQQRNNELAAKKSKARSLDKGLYGKRRMVVTEKGGKKFKRIESLRDVLPHRENASMKRSQTSVKQAVPYKFSDYEIYTGVIHELRSDSRLTGERLAIASVPSSSDPSATRKLDVSKKAESEQDRRRRIKAEYQVLKNRLETNSAQVHSGGKGYHGSFQTLLDQNLTIRKRIAAIEGELFFHYNQTKTREPEEKTGVDLEEGIPRRDVSIDEVTNLELGSNVTYHVHNDR